MGNIKELKAMDAVLNYEPGRITKNELKASEAISFSFQISLVIISSIQPLLH